MSDPNAPHDPIGADAIDQAYVEAEAMLRDEAERAARRARVLGAVAAAGAASAEVAPEAPPTATATVVHMPTPRKIGWRPAPWLMAAGVAGFAALVALRINPPTVIRPPQLPDAEPQPTPGAAPPAPATLDEAPAPAPLAPAAVAPPPKIQPRPPVSAPPDVVPPPPLPIPPVEKRVEQPAPPPPLPIPPVERRVEMPAPPVITQAPPPRSAAAGDVTVSGQSSRAFPGEAATLETRLRAAAAAGRTRDLRRLLADGAAIDAPDAEGRTALMLAVQARQPSAVAFLRRNGADLDRHDNAGVSARRLAEMLDDPAIKRALGLPR